jgi:hypothetical protein
MPLKFNLPTPHADYTLRELDGLKTIPKDEHENIEMLLKILPKEDELQYYSLPLPNADGTVDWYEDGVAIVRDGEIFVLAKLDEYHDCGVF